VKEMMKLTKILILNDFEPVPETLKRQELTKECLRIRGLRKEFGPKIAVENSNINMYNG
jgi:hypothetical protein